MWPRTCGSTLEHTSGATLEFTKFFMTTMHGNNIDFLFLFSMIGMT